MSYNDFKNETIDVFAIATGVYTAYFNKFYESLVNFFPDNKKRLHIASDRLSEYNNCAFPEKNIISVEVTHILDMPHAIVAAHKTYLQKECNRQECKYIFYFDIDTVFMNVPDSTWEFIFKKIDDGNIVMSKHPHYDSAEEDCVWNLIEQNNESAAYIPDYYNEHIISSFWCGKTEEVLKMCDRINANLKQDLLLLRYIPRFVDENYINNIIWRVKTGDITDLKFYESEHLVTLPNKHFTVDTPHIFLLQKYDISIKDSKKQC